MHTTDLSRSLSLATVRSPVGGKFSASSCNTARLQQALTRPDAQKMTAIEARTLSILIFIVSLLAEHCDFDRLRLENAGAHFNIKYRPM